MDERRRIMSAHKGMDGGGWRGWQGLDLKMEADHNWSPETRLQGCAGSLVVDMYQNPQKNVWPTLSGCPPVNH